MTETEQANAEAVASSVGRITALYIAGQLTVEAFKRAFALLIYAGKVRASHLAEASLWQWSLANWPEPIAPVGIAPEPQAFDALTEAAQTLLDDLKEEPGVVLSFQTGTNLQTRAERIAKDSTQESGRQTRQSRMKAAGITGWKWVAQPDACDECKHRHGRVYPIAVTFRDHPLCRCDLEPATPRELAISQRKIAAAVRKKEAHAREVADPAGADHGAVA